MAPKPKPTNNNPSSPRPHGFFSGIIVFLVEKGVQPRRLQVPMLTLNVYLTYVCLPVLCFFFVLTFFVGEDLEAEVAANGGSH